MEDTHATQVIENIDEWNLWNLEEGASAQGSNAITNGNGVAGPETVCVKPTSADPEWADEI